MPWRQAAAYTVETQVAIPGGLSGSWQLIVATDYYDYQPEADGTNNQSVHALTLSAPDLVLTPGEIVSTIGNGETLTVDWTVANQGSAAADTRWREQVLLSKDAYLGNFDDIIVGHRLADRAAGRRGFPRALGECGHSVGGDR